MDMTRNNAREIAVHMAFASGFGNRSADALLEALTPERFAQLGEESGLYAQFPNENQARYIRELVRGVVEHAPELDGYIARYAVGWKFERISRVAAAIMRTAMYEILYMPDVPNAAAVNAAVDIAKGYETPEVVAFINGILGSFIRAEFQDAPPGPERKETSQEARDDGSRP